MKKDIYSEDFKGTFSFVTFKGNMWILKMNWFFFVLTISFGFVIIMLIDFLSSIILGSEFQFGILIDLRFLWIYIIGFILGFYIGAKLDKKIFYRNRKFNQDGDTELLGDISITHRFVRAKLIKWHYVETGPMDGEIIIFLHGLPESWWYWNNQIRELASDYHIYAFDLKGYGQSDKRIGDYRWEGVMEEFLAVLDKLGIEKFNLVGHDRGSVLGDYLGGIHPDRMLRFVRGQQVLHKWTPSRSPQENMFIHPIKGYLTNAFPRIVIPSAFARWYSFSKNKIPRKEIKRAILEYSYPKIAWAVPRYFESNGFAKEVADRKRYLIKNMNFPVLLLEAGLDPFQPKYYYEDAEKLFPNAQLKFIEDASHFWALEKPKELSKIIRDFLSNTPVK